MAEPLENRTSEVAVQTEAISQITQAGAAEEQTKHIDPGSVDREPGSHLQRAGATAAAEDSHYLEGFPGSEARFQPAAPQESFLVLPVFHPTSGKLLLIWRQ